MSTEEAEEAAAMVAAVVATAVAVAAAALYMTSWFCCLQPRGRLCVFFCTSRERNTAPTCFFGGFSLSFVCLSNYVVTLAAMINDASMSQESLTTTPDPDRAPRHFF